MYCNIYSYSDNNVRSLSTAKRYNKQIPKFLHNRPRSFIQHCLSRMPPQKNVKADKIKQCDQDNFQVASEDGASVYTVSFEDVIPTCSCPDFWANKILPCKHILAITIHIPGYSWRELSHDYTQFVLFVLDETCIGQDHNAEPDQSPPATPPINHQSPSLTSEDGGEDRSTQETTTHCSPQTATNGLLVQCRDILKEITRITYLMDEDGAKAMLHDLKDMFKTILPYVEELGGLPRDRKKQKRTKQRKYRPTPKGMKTLFFMGKLSQKVTFNNN